MAIIMVNGYDYVTTDPELDGENRWFYSNTQHIRSSNPPYSFNSPYNVGHSISNARYFQYFLPKHVKSGGFAFHFYRNGHDTSSIVFDLLDDTATGNVHMSMYVDAYNRAYLVRSRTTAVTSSYDGPLIDADRWTHVEMKWFIDDVVGTCALRLNGDPATELSYTGDTSGGGQATAMHIRVNGNVDPHYFDNLVVWDDTGTVNNDWLGEVRVETLRPTGVGANSDFTPSAGANWQNVDETTEDGDTTYNSSTTLGHKDRFTCTPLSSTALNVFAVQSSTIMRRLSGAGAGAGPREIKQVAFDGVTEGLGEAKALDYYYGWHLHVFNTHPTGPALWTPAEVNAGEFGYTITK